MSTLNAKRSFTGNHALLPARSNIPSRVPIPQVPTYHILSWTFGRGSVIWRIWPAVLLHTLFAAAIVAMSLKTRYRLDIPNVMLTVLGVVIGFVISYRAMSGYDRYWMGRTAWSDMVRNSRSLARLIWFHVPPRISPKTAAETETGNASRSPKEMRKVMKEKRQALDLIEGFCVAVKHHIRGELGLYYEDLYPLIRPLHDHQQPQSAVAHTVPAAQVIPHIPSSSKAPVATESRPHSRTSIYDPIIPPITAYGTFDPTRLRHRRSPSSSLSDSSSEHTKAGLLPASIPISSSGMFSRTAGDLVPFSSFFNAFIEWFKPRAPDAITVDTDSTGRTGERYTHRLTHEKHRPLVAGSGQNVPLEVLKCLSEWFSVLEDRGTVPGTSMGPMIGTLAAFEDSLSTVEKILTTPLPFVYSVHIRTVWLYLFFMPSQLIDQFGWYTIPGVAMAAFIYLGFLAAGEEIEQPFGYDENDLDLDLFCREIIHADIQRLKSASCLNAYLGASAHRKNRGKDTRNGVSGRANYNGGVEDSDESDEEVEDVHC